MKKATTLLLLAALLLSQAAACGQSAPSTGDTTAASTTAEPVDSLMPTETKNFGGKTFTIIYSNQQDRYISAEEETGNGINDAIYHRDLTVEEKLNIDIQYSIQPTTTDVHPAVKQAAMAGDDIYDLIINHVNLNLVSYISDNLVMDWNTVPYVNFTKPYWHAGVIDSLSVNGKSPFASGDISINNTVFLLYNKQLAEDLQIGSLYDMVYDGTWTWENLAKISADISTDLNGDTVMNQDDRYGMVVDITGSSWMLRNIPASNGQFIYTNTDNGIELTVSNERSQTVLERACDLFNGGGGYILKKAGATTFDVAASAAAFDAGNYLTYFTSTEWAAYGFNDLSFDYGILPLPKYDEAQETYYSLSWNNNLMVPNSADPEFSGMVSEWMSYYSYRLARPEFYDSLMSTRFAQDEESMDMLDIIFGNMVFDPGMNFKSTGFYGYFDDNVKSNKKDFASVYGSRVEAEKAYIQSLNEMFAGFGE